MALTLRTSARLFARVAAPLLFAASLCACSSIPDWVDPTTWVGENHTLDQSTDAGADSAQPADAGTASDTSQPANAGQTPDIAAIPPKPAPPSTAEEQGQVADSLAADRAGAQYSADALRGGTEAVAPPPPAAAPPPPDTGAAASSSTAAMPKQDETAASQPTAPTPQPDQSGAAGSAPPPPETATAARSPESAVAGAEDAAATGPAPQAAETSAAPADAPSQVASVNAASTSAPAAAPLSPETATTQGSSAPDMQANFAPSKAPALDPSVSQFVPQQILSRYQQTAAAAAAPGVSGGAAVAPVKHRHHRKPKTSRAFWRHYHLADFARHHHLAASTGRYHLAAFTRHHHHLAGFARHQHFAFAQPHSSMVRVGYSRGRTEPLPMSRASADALGSFLFDRTSSPAMEVVEFTQETTLLNDAARNRVQRAARAFDAHGRTGFVRVVGHSSSPVAGLSHQASLASNFERSEAQATAVARELIRDGVPPDRVLVEAVGDPPSGVHHMTQTSRRAEIYLQS
ncbi:MAG TPA: OmpA family protein [Rhizomicrobium sp.]|jgi:flagellar motor protein MotB|nr:OmpA family protein [Rhizomicrobium sp.]